MRCRRHVRWSLDKPILRRGGKREGSGRNILDPTGQKRKSRTIAVTEEELAKVREFLALLRERRSA